MSHLLKPSSITSSRTLYSFECVSSQQVYISYVEPFNSQHGDFHSMLYEASLALGVRFLFDSEVVDVAPDSTKVTLRGGGALQGDVVVIADGYNSSVRSLAMGESEYVAGDEKSLFVTFEVPIDVIRLDKELASLAEPSAVRISPSSHLGYIANVSVTVANMVRRRAPREWKCPRSRPRNPRTDG